ncbi:helix-turn-helix transcriptional regulator [Paracoccus sp. WLY502]|uniref:helix-turn-helix transcriptional regulator n=1 Tax=Paracoccus yibinensis TaxID=3068891 RepID=UPI00358F81AC
MAQVEYLVRDTDVARMLACSRATVWRRTAEGALPAPLRIGGITRWRMSDICDFIARGTPNEKHL